MKLLVGLGNPGPKYELTRHNAGFLVLDQIADQCGIQWEGQKFQGEFGKGQILGEACLLLKPNTFMNLSGRSVSQAMRFYKLGVDDLLVFHDDIDVPFGKVKAKMGGGHGGNNGIRSIIAETGLKDFVRIKLGVGRPQKPEDGQVSDWVLSRFSQEELDVLAKDMVQDAMVRLDSIYKQKR
ncbi:aminoacyl-tRNA hydrolase [Pseudobacteriovorax antillogorgiicola]|uniref:Peptidyl-tRNA hydrolase n=1 Tax=Pseudobacteriovorax antillogorgiicola TaxID=1513793 RepID=A0A1Y6B628_9BACT|nr:aminoacyl-tRNA hydrolase [Pseudobacteriovorax antillogorgiicola]TCS59282.1 peptidyl-tRNA hydrolase [Pseudobacteriovorax antillogorgiicola]SME89769.1 peptidyl-tRNA hydrolase [Pseudobacteriovorax antillogorgiicola]